MLEKEERVAPQSDLFTEQEVEEWFEDESEGELGDDTSATPDGDESVEQKYAKSQLRIVRTTNDFTLQMLREALKDPGYLNLSPVYQRRARWDRKRRSQLIESFLMNIPVPPIFLFENQYNQYEVMDGRQRLETIRDFLENKFALTGMEFWRELNGMRFTDLRPTLQRGLLRRSITAVVLLAETTRPHEADTDVRMILFRRLNTGGARLNPQELRNALYPGSFNDMLVDLARNNAFVRIWAIPPKTNEEKEAPPAPLLANVLYRTMADCELVLRFFAIRETIERNLAGSLRTILDRCMVDHVNDGPKQVERLSRLFQNSLHTLDKLFDEKPFALPTISRPSRPLYDALMVGYSLTKDTKLLLSKEVIQARLTNALLDKKTYDVLVGRGNTVEAIRSRVRTAEDILFEPRVENEPAA